MSDSSRHRPVRSYVLRTGRMTAGQENALQEHWSRWGVDFEQGRFDTACCFGRQAPLVLEIGFGMGDSLARNAQDNPAVNYLGIEVHRPGVGRLFRELEARGLGNVRAYSHDGVEVLRHCIDSASLDGVQVFFPDPWHKKRHHKRRLVNAEFLSLLTRRLKVGGLIHFATDWTPYAETVQSLFEARDDFEPVTAPARPETKFERRGLKLGHQIHDLAFRLTECGTPPGDLQT